MTGRLAGKRALVTGAAQGLGAATAKAIAREGGRVLLTDLNLEGVSSVTAEINRAYGAGTAFYACHDVASEHDWISVIAQAEQDLGGLSVLVNNAGIVVMGSVEDISLSEWQRGLAVNTDSVFLGTKHALRLMREYQPGSIVNISSIAGLIAAHNFANYNASKAAVWMLSKSIALHCARLGWDIRCNSIHPTFIRTPILADLVGDKDESTVLAKLARQVPLGRLGEAEDVAHAVVYLASDESRFMTGAEIKLDGGISAM
ncbi:glucose 1-dehydrogenase [Altererythrobacter salegens]|uniref:Glucose 1-dehydrogenase n=1 Tax=Croceibacterium salegens TaxID=1737568 RepID=A0A6I4T034_9SPHN|nr:SDR family oxidoreductase [Croceibacterium salegens]MXO60637.1 glucose 1-dehydrogenase [Croceibacterium salegens]